MNNVKFEFNIIVNGECYSFNVEDEFTDKEMINEYRPQLEFQRAVNQIERYFNQRQFEKNRQSVKLERAITELMIKEHLAQGD